MRMTSTAQQCTYRRFKRHKACARDSGLALGGQVLDHRTTAACRSARPMQREYGYCPAALQATLVLAEARHPLDLQRVDSIALSAGDLDDLDPEPFGADLDFAIAGDHE